MADAPRVVYLITSHTLPEQVLRLASVLRRGSSEAVIAIHHDDRWCRVDRPALGALGVHLIEPPSVVAWGEFSLLAMVLRCLRWTLEHVDFDWLVLLSGQDYPVRSVAEIERGLGAAAVDAFIGMGQCPRPKWGVAREEFATRYHYRWRPVPAGVARVLTPLAAKSRGVVRTRVLPSGPWAAVPALRSPFGRELICHCGPDWFSLSHASVEAVEHFVRTRPDVLAFYRRTQHPTESFVHTALAASGLEWSNDNRRFVVFDAQSQGRPRTLGMGDLDAIVASGADFARKFDHTIDARVLEEIDRRFHAAEGVITPAG